MIRFERDKDNKKIDLKIKENNYSEFKEDGIYVKDGASKVDGKKLGKKIAGITFSVAMTMNLLPSDLAYAANAQKADTVKILNIPDKVNEKAAQKASETPKETKDGEASKDTKNTEAPQVIIPKTPGETAPQGYHKLEFKASDHAKINDGQKSIFFIKEDTPIIDALKSNTEFKIPEFKTDDGYKSIGWAFTTDINGVMNPGKIYKNDLSDFYDVDYDENDQEIIKNSPIDEDTELRLAVVGDIEDPVIDPIKATDKLITINADERVEKITVKLNKDHTGDFIKQKDGKNEGKYVSNFLVSDEAEEDGKITLPIDAGVKIQEGDVFKVTYTLKDNFKNDYTTKEGKKTVGNENPDEDKPKVDDPLVIVPDSPTAKAPEGYVKVNFEARENATLDKNAKKTFFIKEDVKMEDVKKSNPAFAIPSITPSEGYDVVGWRQVTDNGSGNQNIGETIYKTDLSNFISYEENEEGKEVEVPGKFEYDITFSIAVKKHVDKPVVLSAKAYQRDIEIETVENIDGIRVTLPGEEKPYLYVKESEGVYMSGKYLKAEENGEKIKIKTSNTVVLKPKQKVKIEFLIKDNFGVLNYSEATDAVVTDRGLVIIPDNPNVNAPEGYHRVAFATRRNSEIKSGSVRAYWIKDETTLEDAMKADPAFKIPEYTVDEGYEAKNWVYVTPKKGDETYDGQEYELDLSDYKYDETDEDGNDKLLPDKIHEDVTFTLAIAKKVDAPELSDIKAKDENIKVAFPEGIDAIELTLPGIEKPMLFEKKGDLFQFGDYLKTGEEGDFLTIPVTKEIVLKEGDTVKVRYMVNDNFNRPHFTKEVIKTVQKADEKPDPGKEPDPGKKPDKPTPDPGKEPDKPNPEPGKPTVVNKDDLKSEIDKAEKIKKDAKYLNDIKEDKDKFDKALENAKNVYSDKNAKQTDVDSAKDQLIQAMSKLDGKEKTKPSPGRGGSSSSSSTSYVPETLDNINTNASTKRIAGQDRVQTSIAISKRYFNKADTVVLVGSEKDSDSLSASVLAKLMKAPIILTHANSFDTRIKSEIQRLGAKKVVIIGGENSISSNVMDTIKDSGLDLNIERIFGKDRYETSAIIAKKVADLTGRKGKAVIASGENSVDSLTVAPFAAKEGYPILLVKKDSTPETIKSSIKDLGIEDVFVAGGKSSVSDEAIQGLAKVNERFAGRSRYETSLAIARSKFKDAKGAFVTDANVLADALAISPVAGALDMPVVLTNGKSGNLVVENYVKNESGFKAITPVGGDSTLSQTAVDKLGK